MRAGLPLMKRLLSSSAKRLLVPLGLTAAASTRCSYRNENFWNRHDCSYSEEINDIIKIVTSLEESGLPIKVIKN